MDNSAVPDQTAPRSSLIRVYTVCLDKKFCPNIKTHYRKCQPDQAYRMRVQIRNFSRNLFCIRNILLSAKVNYPAPTDLLQLLKPAE